MMYLGLYLLLGLIFTLIVYYIESPKDFKQFMADVWMVQSVGSRCLSRGNSSRRTLDDLPFMRFTALCIPNCGSTSTSRWMWSRSHSISLISKLHSFATSLHTCLSRFSTAPSRCFFLYFVTHIT